MMISYLTISSKKIHRDESSSHQNDVSSNQVYYVDPLGYLPNPCHHVWHDNFITVFYFIIINYMRKFTINKNKLVITRVRRGQTPPKLQMEIRNGATATAWAPALATKDTNILKLTNSSILRKQVCGQVDKRQRKNREMIRYRSISTLGNGQRSDDKFIRILPITNPDSYAKNLVRGNSQEIIQETLWNVLTKMKENGTVNIKDSHYTVHHEYLLDLISEIIEKIIPQNNKANKSSSEQSQISQIEPYTKMDKTFSVYNQYSFHHTCKKERRLTHLSRVVDEHQLIEEVTIDKQTFWRIVNDCQTHQPTQLIFLLGKMKHLKQQINQRESYAQKLSQQVEQLALNIFSQETQLKAISEKVEQQAKYLREIEQTAKEMENFIDRQPNRILQQQAKEYKQREQELFDLAFLYEQQTPSSVHTFIDQSIMIPLESFKLTIKSFPHQELDSHDDYRISKKSMDDFKASLKSAYDSTIEKLSFIIERKISKIKSFVGIMRRLASYTIGKRQYLSEINKKMSVVSIHIDKNFESLESQLTTHSSNDDALKKVHELKQLFHNVKNIYCEAQVFY